MLELSIKPEMDDSGTTEEAWKHEKLTESKTTKTTTTTTAKGGRTSTVEEESKVVKVDEEEEMVARQVESRQLHVAALEEVVSVNSFFTAAVFIGLSFNTTATSLVTTCQAGQDVFKNLIVSEVIAFSCFLFSSLVAQGLKLQMTLSSLKFSPPPRRHQHHNNHDHTPVKRTAAAKTPHPHHIHPTVLRVGMLLAALSSIMGTIFLMVSMISVIQIRLGVISCESGTWSKRAVYPLITLVSAGVISFISPVLYSVITYKF